jgi:hypothetical protein
LPINLAKLQGHLLRDALLAFGAVEEEDDRLREVLLAEIFGHLVRLVAEHVKIKRHPTGLHHELRCKLGSGRGGLLLWGFFGLV